MYYSGFPFMLYRKWQLYKYRMVHYSKHCYRKLTFYPSPELVCFRIAETGGIAGLNAAWHSSRTAEHVGRGVFARLFGTYQLEYLPTE